MYILSVLLLVPFIKDKADKINSMAGYRPILLGVIQMFHLKMLGCYFHPFIQGAWEVAQLLPLPFLATKQ